jgi:hypothetical protein
MNTSSRAPHISILSRLQTRISIYFPLPPHLLRWSILTIPVYWTLAPTCPSFHGLMLSPYNCVYSNLIDEFQFGPRIKASSISSNTYTLGPLPPTSAAKFNMRSSLLRNSSHSIRLTRSYILVLAVIFTIPVWTYELSWLPRMDFTSFRTIICYPFRSFRRVDHTN